MYVNLKCMLIWNWEVIFLAWNHELDGRPVRSFTVCWQPIWCNANQSHQYPTFIDFFSSQNASEAKLGIIYQVVNFLSISAPRLFRASVYSHGSQWHASTWKTHFFGKKIQFSVLLKFFKKFSLPARTACNCMDKVMQLHDSWCHASE